MEHYSNLFLIFMCFLPSFVCFDPFSYFPERCSDYWIPNNITGLSDVLSQRLHGQHIVLKAVLNHIHGHINASEPSKALTLSFHGGTGTGKNYVSRIIAEHLYKEGMKSKFVHNIFVSVEFKHESKISEYKDKIQFLIEDAVYSCPRSLFIFHEIHHMPAGLIDSIAPYIDNHDNIKGLNYRKAIFIFTSNTASQLINDYVLQRWRDGIPRGQLELLNLQTAIANELMNTEKSFLWRSSLAERHLITAYIPFLPLERTHVRKCIKDRLVAKGYCSSPEQARDSDIDRVMRELTFYPVTEQIFSTSGCKRVDEKVNFAMGKC